MINAKRLKQRMRRPSTPGDVLADILETNAITQTELARRLKVSRRTVSQIIHGHRPIGVDMAVRLGAVFGNGPELWLNMQQAVDLWDVLHAHSQEYEALKPFAKSQAA
jgi:addiction module HigA family antidote